MKKINLIIIGIFLLISSCKKDNNDFVGVQFSAKSDKKFTIEYFNGKSILKRSVDFHFSTSFDLLETSNIYIKIIGEKNVDFHLYFDKNPQIDLNSDSIIINKSIF